ncbi:hypothetical protein BJ508DRAFT_333924 [Ascobolus immersus RN42]|uniref:DUF6589 domain-containing protein n=1 Tax=Ascobolus immersus RN42 TaxID=1160509 RepID=A0A3N4HK05_ASCIM|nr:hypothetical protein BJ508DRAFT_333924 [Ascobolus immersus RN42]
MLNETQGYIFFPNTTIDNPKYLTEDDIDRQAAHKLKVTDCVPNLDDYLHNSEVHVYRILYRHYRGPMQRQIRTRGDTPLPAIEAVHPLPLLPTRIYPLPTIELNESRIDDTISIVEEIHRKVGVTPEEITSKRMVISTRGDMMTINVLGSALFQRSDCTEYAASFGYLDPTMGHFHMGMKLAEYIVANYYGRTQDGKDPASIHRFVKMFGESKVKVGFNAKEFRHVDGFIRDLLAGMIIAACWAASDCHTDEQFAKWLSTGTDKDSKVLKNDWYGLIKTIVDLAFSPTTIQKSRYDASTGKLTAPPGPKQQNKRGKGKGNKTTAAADNAHAPTDDATDNPIGGGQSKRKRGRGKDKDQPAQDAPPDRRNVPFENSLLFIRDCLMYLEFWDAIRTGDTGRLDKNLQYWTVLFQATSHTAYAKELIHLRACLKHIWSDRAKQVWFESTILNLFGKDGSWKTDDEAGEDVVLETKKVANPSLGIMGSHNRDIMVRQSFVSRLSRKNMYRTSKTPVNSDHSTLGNSEKQRRTKVVVWRKRQLIVGGRKGLLDRGNEDNDDG